MGEFKDSSEQQPMSRAYVRVYTNMICIFFCLPPGLGCMLRNVDKDWFVDRRMVISWQVDGLLT